MGSGCTNNNSSSAVLFQKLTPDTMVQYNGPSISSLGICNGDLLSEVEAVILQQIINYSTAVGITVPSIDLTTCDCFTQAIGCCGPSSCISLTCILQAYLDCMCAMYTDIQTLKTNVDDIEGPYDTTCLSGVTPTSKFSAIFQEVITELCTAESNITAIQTQLNNLSSSLNTVVGNFLNSAIRTCGTGSDSVVKSGTGSTFTLEILGTVPIGTIVMYNNANPGWFDSSGKGFSTSPACGWAYCNGLNGTIDMRNQFPVGITNMAGSGSLKPNAGTAIYGSPLSIGGEQSHLLTSTESGVASSSLTVTEPNGGRGHDHSLYAGTDGAASGNGTQKFNYNPTAGGFGNTASHSPVVSARSSTSGNPPSAYIDYKPSGITVTQTPSNAVAAHENRPPFTPLIFIQRIS